MFNDVILVQLNIKREGKENFQILLYSYYKCVNFVTRSKTGTNRGENQ